MLTGMAPPAPMAVAFSNDAVAPIPVAPAVRSNRGSDRYAETSPEMVMFGQVLLDALPEPGSAAPNVIPHAGS